MKRLFIIIMIVGMSAGCMMPELIDPRDDQETFAINHQGEPTDDDAEASDEMRIVFIDVGQGDSTLVIAPNKDAILIDAGPIGAGYEKVLPTLERENVQQLTAIIATHYHADHIGGISEVLSEFTPHQGIYDRGGSYEGESFAWDEYRVSTDGMRTTVYPGDRLRFGEVAVEVVAADGVLRDETEVAIDPADENATSIALVIEYEAFRMFMGGDLTGGGGNPPYDTDDVETPLAPLVGDVDVLQVNHHGSTTSTNQAFLDYLQPEIAIISCGDGNWHFHPHQNVIDRLQNSGVEVYQTERCWTSHDVDVTVAHGDITIVTDGTEAGPPIF
jgi:beta-lactamase superfamily II metal-dependent hydrolase